MTQIPRQNLIWTAFIATLNILAIWFLLKVIKDDGSDKAPILFWFYYPLIIFGDFIAWLTLRLRKKSLSRQVKYIIIALLILFIPLLFFAFI
jgi:hypothetical protein